MFTSEDRGLFCLVVDVAWIGGTRSDNWVRLFCSWRRIVSDKEIQILSTVFFYSAGQKWANLGESERRVILTEVPATRILERVRAGVTKSAKRPFYFFQSSALPTELPSHIGKGEERQRDLVRQRESVGARRVPRLSPVGLPPPSAEFASGRPCGATLPARRRSSPRFPRWW
jgi:hypothetical protein